MKTIRNKVFETNSSSTHSFTVAQGDYKVYSPIEPCWYEEFGWSFDTWNSPESKLAYILRCLAGYEYHYLNYESDEQEYLHKDERINQNLITLLTPLQQRLHNLGVDFEIPTYEDMDDGYVDHADWYKSDIEEIIATDEGLLNFIFNPYCEINGGNDNEW